MTPVRVPTALLGGLSPQAFMRRVWQRRPWLVRQAWPGVQPPLPRPELFALAAREGVESRLVQREKVSGRADRAGAAMDGWRSSTPPSDG